MALAHPRWEDYNYEFLDGVKNRLYWLGSGDTVADIDPEADSERMSYLQTQVLI